MVVYRLGIERTIASWKVTEIDHMCTPNIPLASCFAIRYKQAKPLLMKVMAVGLPLLK